MIPRGETRSYKQIAAAIRHPNAFRAVASALAKNTDKTVPCHRVIRADGSLGGYNGLLARHSSSGGGRGIKARLLKTEGAL